MKIKTGDQEEKKRHFCSSLNHTLLILIKQRLYPCIYRILCSLFLQSNKLSDNRVSAPFSNDYVSLYDQMIFIAMTTILSLPITENVTNDSEEDIIGLEVGGAFNVNGQLINAQDFYR